MTKYLSRIVALILTVCLAMDSVAVMGFVGAGFHPRPPSEFHFTQSIDISGSRPPWRQPLQIEFASQALALRLADVGDAAFATAVRIAVNLGAAQAAASVMDSRKKRELLLIGGQRSDNKLQKSLAREGFDVKATGDERYKIAGLPPRPHPWAAAVVRGIVKGRDSFEVVHFLRLIYPDLPILLVSNDQKANSEVRARFKRGVRIIPIRYGLKQLKMALQNLIAAGPPRVARFSSNEIRIMQRLAEGLSNEDIAGRLRMATERVAELVYSIGQKLGIPFRKGRHTESFFLRAALRARLFGEGLIPYEFTDLHRAAFRKTFVDLRPLFKPVLRAAMEGIVTVGVLAETTGLSEAGVTKQIRRLDAVLQEVLQPFWPASRLDFWLFAALVKKHLPEIPAALTERRDTWPGPTGEYGNAGVAYAFPPNVNRRNASLLKRIVRVLKENRLYYGLKAADVSWLLEELGDKAVNPLGKIVFSDDAAREEAVHFAGDEEFVIGRMRRNGPFVIRLQAEAFHTWRWNDQRKSHRVHDEQARRKLAIAFKRAVRALAGLSFKRGDESKRIIRRVLSELRSLHDYYGETFPAEKVIVLCDLLLKNLSALTIVMIHEMNQLLNPGPDTVDRLALDLRLSADALGWSAFIKGLKFLGLLSLVEQASGTVKAAHNESLPRMRSPTGRYLGFRLRIDEDLAALFYSTLAKSILALRLPWDDKRNLFPVPLGPLAGAA